MGARKNINVTGTDKNTAAVTGLGTISSITSNVITASGTHGLNAGDQVQFVNSGGALPTGISAGVGYFVIAAGLTTTAFAVSTTQGGTAATISGGSGTNTIKVVVSHFEIVSASTAGTVKSNPIALTSPALLGNGDKLDVADAGIYALLGITGATNIGHLKDAILQAMLDAQLAAGDYILWMSNGAAATPSELGVLARTSVDSWDSAITF